VATDLDIQQAVALLDKPAVNAVHPPTIVIMSPETGDFILGNRDGFVQLAVASLKAAQGEVQSFKNKDWVKIDDLDWRISGLKPDPIAHIYQPVKKTRFQKAWRNVLGTLAVLMLVLFILVGFITSVRWALHVN
jgi:hypothetical protein